MYNNLLEMHLQLWLFPSFFLHVWVVATPRSCILIAYFNNFLQFSDAHFCSISPCTIDCSKLSCGSLLVTCLMLFSLLFIFVLSLNCNVYLPCTALQSIYCFYLSDTFSFSHMALRYVFNFNWSWFEFF